MTGASPATAAVATQTTPPIIASLATPTAQAVPEVAQQTATPIVAAAPKMIPAAPNTVVQLPPRTETAEASPQDNVKEDVANIVNAQASSSLSAMTQLAQAIRTLDEKVNTIQSKMPVTTFPKVMNQEPSIAAYADASSKQFEIKDAILHTVS